MNTPRRRQRFLMDVVRLVESKVLSVVEKILEVLEGDSDYSTFEAKLKKELDGLGCEILKEVLEALDRKIRESEDRKRSWAVVRKNDQKEILTPFGPLVYERSYYRHKESKQYSYLVDKKVGITPHARVGVNLKADLSEACAGVSYEGATLQISRHNPELKVSRQTVATCVKDFKAKEVSAPPTKRCVPVLYVEADEDHLKVKGHRGAQARLIYVHEGVEEDPRHQLKNARYFTTVHKKPEEFWTEVCNYIESHYEFSKIEAIYLSGDGAPWIRSGQEYIPGAIYILDKFHLAKYILRATAHMPDLKTLIYKAIQKLDKQAVLGYLQVALQAAEKAPRQKRIKDTITYIDNNWDGIESSVKYPHVGCSAEGHVSHILAARLSSRPMAWSLKGADNMASMRAVRANGESVYEHYRASREPAPVIVELNQEVKRELRRLKEKRLLGGENLNNVPLFNGRSNFTRTALKGLNEKMVV
jgi:hypothetical protein